MGTVVTAQPEVSSPEVFAGCSSAEAEVKVESGSWGLYRAMLRVVWKELLLSGFLRIVVLLWEFSQPLLLQ